MMRLALDTNAYSILKKGAAPQLYKLTEEADEVALPFIVIGELRSGFAGGSRGAENNRSLELFLDGDLVSALYADDATTVVYGELRSDLKKRGTPIPTNDLWIAALCLRYDFVLATGDKHFAKVPLLRIVALD